MITKRFCTNKPICCQTANGRCILHGCSMDSDSPHINFFYIFFTLVCYIIISSFPDSKVHGVNMGPIWVLSAPDGPHVGPMNLIFRVSVTCELYKIQYVCCGCPAASDDNNDDGDGYDAAADINDDDANDNGDGGNTIFNLKEAWCGWILCLT